MALAPWRHQRRCRRSIVAKSGWKFVTVAAMLLALAVTVHVLGGMASVGAAPATSMDLSRRVQQQRRLGCTASLACTGHRPLCLRRPVAWKARGGLNEASNSTGLGDDDNDAPGAFFTSLRKEFESGEFWERPIASNIDGGAAVVGFVVLVWLLVALRLAFDFLAAQQQGDVGVERFFGAFFLKALAVSALLALGWLALQAFGPSSAEERNGRDAQGVWEDFWTGDYWNEPIAIDPRLVALGVAGGAMALLATSALLARGTQVVDEMSIQRLPMLSLDQETFRR
mmetsp:Transcript_58316/g.162543  ORF Transcript_58316/g.162543 Transcript_58316/m.162543 type:complete len:284 (-) Transcript_58316:19-870(-)